MGIMGRERLRRRGAWVGAMTFAISYGLWVLFIGTWAAHELLVGLVLVAAATAFGCFVGRSSKLEATFRWVDVKQAWRVPWYAVADSWAITEVLLRDVLGGQRAEGAYRVCGYAGSDRDPVKVGREVLATAYSTATPNSIVIGIDTAQNRMLFHQIKRTEMTEMGRELGAKA